MNSHCGFLDFLHQKSLNNKSEFSVGPLTFDMFWLIKAALDHTVGGLPKIGL